MLVSVVPNKRMKVENDFFFNFILVFNLFEVPFMVSAPNIHLWSFPEEGCLLFEFRALFPGGRMLGYRVWLTELLTVPGIRLHPFGTKVTSFPLLLQ